MSCTATIPGWCSCSIRRASCQVGAITFSANMGLPARAAAVITERWVVVAVVTITPFDTEAEVLALANGVPFGLSASLWTLDLARAKAGVDRGTGHPQSRWWQALLRNSA